MATYFFDTSALVKAYVRETVTSWVRAIVSPSAKNDIFISRLAEVEMTSAMIRRRNRGSLSDADAATLLRNFRHDAANEFISLDVTHDVLTNALRLVETHGLRAYDGLQLATAIALHLEEAGLPLSPATLVSADVELNTAGQAEGLLVDDPNEHL